MNPFSDERLWRQIKIIVSGLIFLAPFGIWKIIEIWIWIFSHIDISYVP